MLSVKLRRKQKKKRQSAGIYIGLNAAYMVFADGEHISEQQLEKSDLEKTIRRFQNVITCIRSSGVIYKNVILPKNIKDKEIKDAVKWQFLDLEPDSYEIIYKNTGFTTQDDINIICAAVPKKDINEFARKNKNIYSGLELESFALWRGCSVVQNSSEPRIIISSTPMGVIMVAGRSNIEFAREIPAGANVDFERMRTVDYYKRAFDAADVKVKELKADEHAYMTALGCALALYDSEFINLLPEEARKIRAAEFKKPKQNEIIAAISIIALALSFFPHGLALYYNNKARAYETPVRESAAAVEETERVKRELDDITRQIGIVNSFKARSYMNVINDIRYAMPNDMALDKLDIVKNTGQETQVERNGPQAANNERQEGQKNTEKPDEKQNEPNVTNKTPASMPQSSSSDRAATYKPDTVDIVGKSQSLKSIGLFVDNLMQLPYVRAVAVYNDISYDKNTSLYSFMMKLGIDLENLRK